MSVVLQRGENMKYMALAIGEIEDFVFAAGN